VCQRPFLLGRCRPGRVLGDDQRGHDWPDSARLFRADCARIKAEVVSADEREGDLRRILNYGHTLGHALEAETGYRTLLHGEAVAFGMIAAGRLAEITNLLTSDARESIERTILDYGPIAPFSGVTAASLEARLGGDKKTIGGKVHFVLAESIGQVRVVSGIEPEKVIAAADAALHAVGAA
jgi:3-dehydroquinate synthase